MRARSTVIPRLGQVGPEQASNIALAISSDINISSKRRRDLMERSSSADIFLSRSLRSARQPNKAIGDRPRLTPLIVVCPLFGSTGKPKSDRRLGSDRSRLHAGHGGCIARRA